MFEECLEGVGQVKVGDLVELVMLCATKFLLRLEKYQELATQHS